MKGSWVGSGSSVQPRPLRFSTLALGIICAYDVGYGRDIDTRLAVELELNDVGPVEKWIGMLTVEDMSN